MTLPEIPGFGGLREIGRGGYSRVFEAREYEFDRLVAVKVLNEPIKDGTTAAAFERECRTMGRLVHHPNIVTIIKSAFTADDQPCIVMELFHEGSYFQMLRNSGPVEVDELLRVGVKIAGALATAHETGVVHGDVKPHNIFRSRFGEPALGDFGIATFVSRREGRLPRGFSVHYAAPDLVDGAPSPASDQYSLAATLYTMALGRRPFEASEQTTGRSSEQVLLRVLKEPVPRLPERFPHALADALWRAMAKDPDYRFEGLSEFATELNAAEAERQLRQTVMPLDGPVTPAIHARDFGHRGTLDVESPWHDEYALRAGTASSAPRQEPDTKAFLQPVSAGLEPVDEARSGNLAGVERHAGTGADTAAEDIVGTLIFSDGRTELLDTDMIVGRNPTGEPLEPHQRAVTHGHGDRTVSRQHLELRIRDGRAMAVGRGRHSTVVARDGTKSDLLAGETRALEAGDTLRYGNDSWLRFEPSGKRRGHAAEDMSMSADRLAASGCVVLSDGRVEQLDASLIIGRNPEREPLEPHERAVVHGVGDRTVSRRHLEVSVDAGRLLARVLGRSVVAERPGGSIQKLTTGQRWLLEAGDKVHFGLNCWLSYNDGETA